MLLFLEFLNINLIEKINEETLSLRKKKHKQDLISRLSALISDNPIHSISPIKLKGILKETLENLKISDNKLEDLIEKTITYLNSKELDEIKLGVFLLSDYFSKIFEHDEKKKNILKILILIYLLKKD